MLKRALGLLAVVAVVAATVLPAAAGCGPKELPTVDGPAFGPEELKPVDGPGL